MKLLQHLNKKQMEKMTFEEIRKLRRDAGFKQRFYDGNTPIGVYELYARGYFTVAISKESDSEIFLSISHKQRPKLDRAEQLLNELHVPARFRNYGERCVMFIVH